MKTEFKKSPPIDSTVFLLPLKTAGLISDSPVLRTSEPTTFFIF